MFAHDASTAIDDHPYEPKSVGVKSQSGLGESDGIAVKNAKHLVSQQN
jgi:hypothetical protein